MIRALSLDLRPADAARYSEVRRNRLQVSSASLAYKESEEVYYRCPICRNLGSIQPCLKCRLENDIPLPEEMLLKERRGVK